MVLEARSKAANFMVRARLRSIDRILIVSEPGPKLGGRSLEIGVAADTVFVWPHPGYDLSLAGGQFDGDRLTVFCFKPTIAHLYAHDPHLQLFRAL